MSFYGKKEFLQLLPRTLLFAGNAGEDSDGHADKRTEYAAPSSALIDYSCGRGNEKQESGKKAGCLGDKTEMMEKKSVNQ